MHKCEVTIFDEDLGTFLDVAEDLKITGLSAENNLQSLDPTENNPVSKKSKENPKTKNLVSVRDSQCSCNICNKQYTNWGNLWQHKTSTHEGVKYLCDQCNSRSFIMAGKLRRHKAPAHERVRYLCVLIVRSNRFRIWQWQWHQWWWW